MSKVNMDFLGHGKATGALAGNILANGMNPDMQRPMYNPKTQKAYVSIYQGGDVTKKESYKILQVNDATLRKDEWKQLDDAIIGIAESRLRGVRDLMSRGLTYGINGLGTTVLESEAISDAMEAEMTMDGVHRGKGDRQEFSSVYLPLPIIHVDYDINERVLASSRNRGDALDTTQAERASRKVAEKLEQMLFTDVSYTRFGGTIYSYVNFPSRNKVTLSTAWTDSSMTGKKIVDDVLAMKQALLDAHFFGPFQVYIPSAYETLLDEDYNDYRGGTIRERINAIASIAGIEVIDTLADGNVLMVQMTSDVVRLVQGLPMTNVQEKRESGMTTHFKVMTIQVPQLRADYNGACGICHLESA
jgi:hypothetical protein